MFDSAFRRTTSPKDPTLATGSSGTLIKKAHIVELRQHATASSSNYKSISDFVTALYQGSLHGSHPTSGELSSGVSTLSAAQAQGPAALLAAAQTLGSTIFNSSACTGLGTSDAQFVSDLYTGFLQRPPDDSGQSFWLGILAGHDRAYLINEFATCEEFRTAVAALGLSGTNESLHYVLTDIQGLTRAVMNSNGSSSAVVARCKYPLNSDH